MAKNGGRMINFRHIGHSPSRFKQNFKPDYKNAFSLRFLEKIVCANELVHIKGQRTRERNRTTVIFRYLVGENKKWEMRLPSESPYPLQAIKLIWVNSKKVEGLLAYPNFGENRGRIRIFDLKTRRFSGGIEIDRSILQQLKDQSRIELVMFDQTQRFSLISISYYWQNFFLWIASNKNSSMIDTKIKLDLDYRKEIPEREYCKYLKASKISVFGSLIALKCFWVDKEYFDRDCPNMSKFHTIVIIEVDLQKKEAKQVSNLSKITEGMFSSLRIDSFFFIDRYTLGIVMNHIVLVVDWKEVEVVRCIEVAGLTLPGDHLRGSLYRIHSWYDRKMKAIFFKVGLHDGSVDQRDENKPWTPFNSELEDFKVKFYLTKYIRLEDLNVVERHKEEFVRTEASQELPEEELLTLNQTRASTDRTILD